MNKLFDGLEDFDDSIAKGLELVKRPDLIAVPTEADKENMKSLYALFVVGTIKMDPASVQDTDIDTKLYAVRMALLAAYNLGRKAK